MFGVALCEHSASQASQFRWIEHIGIGGKPELDGNFGKATASPLVGFVEKPTNGSSTFEKMFLLASKSDSNMGKRLRVQRTGEITGMSMEGG